MFDNETHCKSCQITFNSIAEIAYLDINKPCCPRCESEDLEMFRLKGKIVQNIMKDKMNNTSEPGELCPLCNEPIDNGKSHGSWCK